jgi:hypothetical protein
VVGCGCAVLVMTIAGGVCDRGARGGGGGVDGGGGGGDDGGGLWLWLWRWR